MICSAPDYSLVGIYIPIPPRHLSSVSRRRKWTVMIPFRGAIGESKREFDHDLLCFRAPSSRGRTPPGMIAMGCFGTTLAWWCVTRPVHEVIAAHADDDPAAKLFVSFSLLHSPFPFRRTESSGSDELTIICLLFTIYHIYHLPSYLFYVT
ncbi:uncharacterized protein LDX57_004472 [Aspergillus melleus]|uniref:uncharacterized protein n=1 Tax=Aspergillus melleus TaxID=138277 RepID=UPI001E8E2582|nr:uncharacterized protein LDX57_004472 [Aspergillus melleus]KAH8426739.1 hypothetical protein LDX57_004472 [Aspergillus melleus]